MRRTQIVAPVSPVEAVAVETTIPVSAMAQGNTAPPNKKPKLLSTNVKLDCKLKPPYEAMSATIMKAKATAKRLANSKEAYKNEVDNAIADYEEDEVNGLHDKVRQLCREYRTKEQEAKDDEVALGELIHILPIQRDYLAMVRRVETIGELEQLEQYAMLLTRTINNVKEFRKVDIRSYESLRDNLRTYLDELEHVKRTYVRDANAPMSQEW